ncbi:MAG TPA: Tim44/TimA family putative adaptor protein [Stellaceae bacterium]|nr:Tim44/TimA family putative adaptor protein [Stellaceae bacterium]
MGDGFQYIDIVIFALIAGFLVLRLRSVLGRRTGNERRRDAFGPAKPETAPDKVIDLATRAAPIDVTPAPAAESLSGSASLKAADPRFDEAAFLRGARGAFEIIVNAFAAGDTASLQPLLSEEVYGHFAEAIRARTAAHEKLETTLLSVKTVAVTEGGTEGDNAVVTVKFVSDQINVVRGADGSTVEGNPNQVVEKTDLWTFSRPLRSRDPNWTLVATHSP